MAPRSLVFAAGFTCGALLFIAMQSFGQSDMECRDWGCVAPMATAPDEVSDKDSKALGQSDVLQCRDAACAAPELPALGAAPKDRKPEKEKNLLIPVGVTIGMIGVLSLWGKGTTLPCAQYPCAHYAHVGTGAAIGYLFTSYYTPASAFGAGFAVAIGKEVMDKRNGKSFSRTDVATRLLGTGIGVYIARSF